MECTTVQCIGKVPVIISPLFNFPTSNQLNAYRKSGDHWFFNVIGLNFRCDEWEAFSKRCIGNREVHYSTLQRIGNIHCSYVHKSQSKSNGQIVDLELDQRTSKWGTYTPDLLPSTQMHTTHRGTKPTTLRPALVLHQIFFTITQTPPPHTQNAAQLLRSVHLRRRVQRTSRRGYQPLP